MDMLIIYNLYSYTLDHYIVDENSKCIKSINRSDGDCSVTVDLYRWNLLFNLV